MSFIKNREAFHKAIAFRIAGQWVIASIYLRAAYGVK